MVQSIKNLDLLHSKPRKNDFMINSIWSLHSILNITKNYIPDSAS